MREFRGQMQNTVKNDNKIMIGNTGYMVNDKVIDMFNSLYEKHPEYFTRAEYLDKAPVKKDDDKPSKPFNPDTYTKSTFLPVSEVEQRDKRTFVVTIDWLKDSTCWKTNKWGKRVIKSDLLTIVNEALKKAEGTYDKERKEYIFTTQYRAKKFYNLVQCISADRRKAVWASYNTTSKES